MTNVFLSIGSIDDDPISQMASMHSDLLTNERKLIRENDQISYSPSLSLTSKVHKSRVRQQQQQQDEIATWESVEVFFSLLPTWTLIVRFAFIHLPTDDGNGRKSNDVRLIGIIDPNRWGSSIDLTNSHVHFTGESNWKQYEPIGLIPIKCECWS